MGYRAVSKVVVAALIAVVVIAVGVAAYFFYARPPPPAKKVVIYASLSEMTTLDPSTEFSNSIIVLSLLYEPLLWYDPLTGQKIPALAESWESRENGTIWVFHLRKGVVFHDGTPLTAHAVKYSIERTITLGMGAAFIWAPVEEIVVVDDYTVEFRLKYPAPLDMIAAASYGAWIFSPKTHEYAGAESPTDPEVADWFNAGHDTGSGPYRIVKWDPENEVVLEKFEDWWGWKTPGYPMADPNAPDVFIIKIVKDAVVQEKLVLAGDIQIAEYVPLEDVEMLKEDPRVQVVIKPSFQNLLLLFNTRKPPLDNVLVRRAIAHAIPYEDIVKVARAGLARVASGPIPYGMPGHFEDLRFEYNLTKARELLAEAGYPEGGFKLLLVYTAGDVYEKKTAELIKASLAVLGIEVEIRPMSWEEQWALAQAGWEDPMKAQDLFIFYWWPTYITPYDFLYNMFHNEENTLFNLCYYENPEFERLIDEAVYWEGINYTRALELYHEAQKILYEDVPAVPLWDSVDVRVAVSTVGNLEKAVNPAYPTVIFAQVLSAGG